MKYTPTRELAVDEKFRVRFVGKQYMLKKPTKWGDKVLQPGGQL